MGGREFLRALYNAGTPNGSPAIRGSLNHTESTQRMSTRIIQLPRPVSRTQVQDPEKIPKPRRPVEPSALTAEQLRSVLDYDQETGIFTWKVRTSNVKVGDVAGCLAGEGYLLIGLQRRRYHAHRLAWLYVYGSWPKDQIDHINRIRTDNRISNLREVTNKQNMQNAGKRRDNTSGYQGVSWHKHGSKWQVGIVHNQQRMHLGLFDDLEAAIAARKTAEKLYWADTNLD